MNAGIYFGATVEAVKASKETIMEIMRCGEADSAVKMQALITLRTMTSVKNVTVKDCEIAVVAEPKQSDSLVDEVPQASDEQKASYDKVKEVWNARGSQFGSAGGIDMESLSKVRMDWTGAQKPKFSSDASGSNESVVEIDKNYTHLLSRVSEYLVNMLEFQSCIFFDEVVWLSSDGNGTDVVSMGRDSAKIVRIPKAEPHAAPVVWIGKPEKLLERLRQRYDVVST